MRRIAFILFLLLGVIAVDFGGNGNNLHAAQASSSNPKLYESEPGSETQLTSRPLLSLRQLRVKSKPIERKAHRIFKKLRKRAKGLAKKLRKRAKGLAKKLRKRAKGFAVASMVLGIVSLVSPFFFGTAVGVLAIVFGGVALHRMKKNKTESPEAENGKGKGKGKAIAGLITGIVGFVGWTIATVAELLYWYW